LGTFGFGKKKVTSVPTPAAVQPAPPEQRPDPKGKNNFIIVILDSCRYDSFTKAAPKVITKLGTLQKRFSYASWTAPSHYNLLMGLLPHSSPPHVFASEYYKEDFFNFNKRLGAEGIEFSKLIPTLYFPIYLKETMGYTTHGRVSLPVLNPRTPINQGFDSYKLMDKHNDMDAMLDTMTFDDDRPSFYFLNVGETHYPYATPDEDPKQWPRISGVHGVFKHLDENIENGKLKTDDAPKFFNQEKLDTLRDRQVNTVNYLDTVFERLFNMVPRNTWIIVTADHGELFGEEGYFGHGPIQHDKVFEVPFLEGPVP